LPEILYLDLINAEITSYAEQFSSPEPTGLQEIAMRTKQQHPQSHMLSGHLQGRFLAMISRLISPAFILEIGTFTGYSAVCLAEGLKPGGELHTIELREEEVTTARKNIAVSPGSNQIFVHQGYAATIIPALDRQWDLVFIDADKTGYIDYYELILPRVRKGGLILADNVLFHGEVLESPIRGKSAKAIHAFNEHVKSDNRVEKVLLTLRDGLLLLLKK
jgi:caffeoyl-CoA O-methyltransferase